MFLFKKHFKRILSIFIFILLSFSLSIAQGTLLVKKGYKTKARFLPGQSISLKVENRYFSKITGHIEDIADDYIIVDGEMIELKIILQVIIPQKKINFASCGANLLLGGILYPAIYLVNGILDGSKQYYSTGSLATGLSMILSGALLYSMNNKKFNVKKRFHLITIPVNP